MTAAPERMPGAAAPHDAPRYRLPEGSDIGMLPVADGVSVRLLTLRHPAPRANLLIASGKSDFLEKWADIYARLHAAGFALAGWDWREQGGSTRAHPGRAGHADDFAPWLADLDHVATAALDRLGTSRPWFMIGHSMGGHLAVRWLAEPRSRAAALRPHMRGLLLTAPFFGLGLPAPLKALLYAMAWLQCRMGNSGDYAWQQGAAGPDYYRQAARRARLTSDAELFEDEARWIEADPALGLGGATWGWIDAARRSIARLRHLPLESLDIPALMLLARREGIVSNAAARAVARRLPRCRVEEWEGAHELMRERNRAAVLDRMQMFMADHGA